MKSIRSYMSVEDIDLGIADVLKLRLDELRRQMPDADMIEITLFKFRKGDE